MSWWPWSKVRREPEKTPSPPDPEEQEIIAEFTLGLRHRPDLALTKFFEPAELDESLMPGATVVGRVVGARPAEVILVEGGVPQAARTYQHLIGLEAHVFLSPEAGDLKWEEALEKVYRAAVLACCQLESFVAPETARACLRRLMGQVDLSEEDRCFQAALEQLELFDLYHPTAEGPSSVSLAALRESPAIYLVDYRYVEYEYVATVGASGALCLSHSSLVEDLLRAYGLSWEREGAMEDAALGDERIVSSKLRDKAVEVDFAGGRWRGKRLEFRVHGREPLIFDFEKSVVTGPLAEKGSARLFFDSLNRADVDEREAAGDTKVHRYFYLHLSDGTQSLVLFQRMREYYESCSGLRDTEARQDLATKVIHAIPASLGVETRLARKDLVSGKSLQELL